jgi:stage V sporulation protein B
MWGDSGSSIYNVAFSVYAFVYILTNSGVPVALSKYVAELRAVNNYEDSVRAFKIARFYLIILGAIFSVALALFSGSIADILHYSSSRLPIIALSPTIFFACVTSAYRGYFQGSSNMTPTAVSQIIEQIVRIIVSLPFAYFFLRYGLTESITAATLGTSIGAFSTLVVLFYIYKKRERTDFLNFKKSIAACEDEVAKNTKHFSFKTISFVILKYSIPVTICVGVQNLGNLVDISNTKGRLLAAGFGEIPANALQFYLAKSQQLMNVPIAIIISLAVVILPAISSALARKDNNEISAKTNYVFRLCFIISLPAAAGFASLSSGFYQLFKYENGSYILMLSSIMIALMSVVMIQSSVLQGLNKLYSVTVFIIIGLSVKILINYFLISIPEINIYGAIIGSVIGYLIPIVLSNMLIKKTLHVKFSLFFHIVKPLVSASLMGITTYFIYWGINTLFGIGKMSGLMAYATNLVDVVICVAWGVIIYSVIMALIGGLKKSDLSALPEKLKRFIPHPFYNLLK